MCSRGRRKAGGAASPPQPPLPTHQHAAVGRYVGASKGQARSGRHGILRRRLHGPRRAARRPHEELEHHGGRCVHSQGPQPSAHVEEGGTGAARRRGVKGGSRPACWAGPKLPAAPVRPASDSRAPASSPTPPEHRQRPTRHLQAGSRALCEGSPSWCPTSAPRARVSAVECAAPGFALPEAAPGLGPSNAAPPRGLRLL